jgi:hypothetical protein
MVFHHKTSIMKNQFSRAWLYIALIVTLLSSCGRDAKKEIAKTWQLSDIETETELTDSLKEAILLSSTFQFTEDGRYTTSGGIGADQGTYTLDEEGETLSTISSAGRNSDVYSIKDLDEDKLVLFSNGRTITLTAIKP